MSRQKLEKKDKQQQPQIPQPAKSGVQSPPSSDVRLIVIPVSTIEERVIAEYAAVCNETVPELVRKAIVREATLADCASTHEAADYQYRMKFSSGLSDKERRRLMEATYNKIRKLMGWSTIRL